MDTNNDGMCDTGGCLDVETSYWNFGPSWMSLYEMDPLDGDELVQRLWFPATAIGGISCEARYCYGSGSDWVGVTSYDNPSYEQRVDAQMAVSMPFATFVDNEIYYGWNSCAYRALYDPQYDCD